MILHQMTLAIRRQDWFTVVLEVTIVVVGILIALQVENWNEARKDRIEAEDWRHQIAADLRQTRFDLEARWNYNAQALVFGERAMELLDSDTPLDESAAWDLVLGAFHAGQIWPYRVTGAAFREVQNAGGLSLVADADVIVRLAHLYDVYAHDYELVSGGLPKYRELVRERLPWPVQEYIWEADCEPSMLVEGYADYVFELRRCDSPPLPELILNTATTLRTDDELIRALRGRLSQLKVSLEATARFLERTDSAVLALEGSL